MPDLTQRLIPAYASWDIHGAGHDGGDFLFVRKR
jgi:hypothetical protein